MKRIGLLAIGALMLLAGCAEKYPGADVVLHTQHGDIALKLYEDTPVHSANFLALARAGVYDGVTFHRVVKEFMIQAGDLTTRKEPNPELPTFGDPTLAPEMRPAHFHKRGALAAARQSDQVNPGRNSSALQFYIVTGRVWAGSELEQVEAVIHQQNQQRLIFEAVQAPENEWIRSFLTLLQNQGAYAAAKAANPDSIAAIETRLNELEKSLIAQQATLDTFRFTDAQRAVYTDVGGSAGLDGMYTVFGEIVSGMEVAQKISEADVDGERPLEPVVINVTVLAKEGKYGPEKLPAGK